MSDIDQSLLQDFLTESGELIEQLDADLVRLESAQGPAVGELCNGCFRALHTIKGAASFLGLTAVTEFAHAAEDALNRLRKGDLAVTAEVMDAMLRSADVVRAQIAAMREGEAAPAGPADLIATLHAIASGEAAPSAPVSPEPAAEAGAPARDYGAEATPLELPAQKLDLLDYMVQDMQDYLAQLDDVFAALGNDATRHDAAAQLAEIGDGLLKTTEFFELDDLTAVAGLLCAAAPTLGQCTDDLLPELSIRLRVTRRLVEQQAEALADRQVLHWPLELFLERMNRLCAGQQIEPQFVGLHQDDVENVMVLDGLIRDAYEAPAEPAAAPVAPAPAPEPENATAAPADEPRAAHVEQTIRVEVGRLESLLNLVGQLVLNKNRVLGLTRTLRDASLAQELKEDFAAAAGELDHLMSELQVGVMRTRMQPLAKLFDRYPRVIRDLARATDKRIRLVIEGKDTEVDKSVLELLADPLVHILRNSADHGIEKPQLRVGAGKAETGTIRLQAQHQGSHVRVAISDDGKGLDRDILTAKAVEKGLITADHAAQMSDAEAYRLIFAPGFSTAAQVSDLSGRGVGMDVVNANIQKLGGTVDVQAAPGKGTTIEILIPLTVAIMPAMVVGVGEHLYSIPLQAIHEIVRPEQVHHVAGRPVMRLREQVLPLVNLQQTLGEPASATSGKFAVVVSVGGASAALLVDRLVGQQEIVIKPLSDPSTQGGPFSGATIREDGEVSLILDVVQLLRSSGPEKPKLEKKAA